MNVLAIETATTACAVGLRLSDGREAVHVGNDERRHTEALAPAIERLLEEAGLVARDVTRVVVDRGPGLFTGLRVGIATGIGFALGVGAELVGVSSLELLAHGAFDQGVRGRLVACVDARRGEVFTQTFQLDDGPSSLDEARVGEARDIVIQWATNGVPVTFTGDGVQRYLSDFAAVPTGVVLDESLPSVHAALALGVERPASDMIVPLYLREADAVANFTTRQRPQ